jgi:hypothetical protein
MKKSLSIFWLNIFFMTQALALQNSCPVNPVEYFQTIAAQIQLYKYQIQHCYETTKAFTECSSGMHGIDPDINTPNKNIASLTTRFGVITVLPVPIGVILPTDSYILTPSISYHTFSWTASGSSVEKGYTNF